VASTPTTWRASFFAEHLAQILRATASVWLSLVAALVATWPLAAHLTSAVPLGGERAATVPLFSLWSLWWTADRLPHGFDGYLDAPFFYPNTGVTTYSEPMPLLGILAAPFWASDAPPALAYNFALLVALTLNGVFAYRVARALAAPAGPALLGAIVAVTLPFAAHVLGVLPNVGVFGLLWTLDGLVRFGRSGSGGWALWAAAGFVATFYTFQQYTLFFAPVVLAAALLALAEQRFRVGAVGRLGVAGLLGTVVVLVLALPTIRIHGDTGGFTRPPEVVQALSARPRDFLTRPDTALLGFPRRDPWDTAGLFPGALLFGLALAGTLVGLRHGMRRRWAGLLAVMAAFGFALALGLNLDLAGWRPFATLRAHVPGFDEVRSPYRAAALFQACLPVLAAVALGRVRLRAAHGAIALVACVGLLAAAENLALPAPLLRLPASTATPWTSWLRAQPERRVLVHVPFPGGDEVSDFEVEGWRMFAQIDHHRPIVNGYSGFFPVARAPGGEIFPAYRAFRLAMFHEFPSERLLCVLTKSLGADTLVADRSWLTAHEGKIRAFRSFLRHAYEDADVRIYALAAPSGACQPG
jgi:hypothetical protein